MRGQFDPLVRQNARAFWTAAGARVAGRNAGATAFRVYPVTTPQWQLSPPHRGALHRTVFAIRRKHAIGPCHVDSWLGHQGSRLADEILEHRVRGLLGDAVLDGVFHERLENQVRHQRVERFGLDVVAHDQAIGEACLLDLEILGKTLIKMWRK